jgi:hypothetical protein
VIRKQTGHASGLPGNPICRKGEKQNSENSPSLHDEVLKAYKNWWRTVRALPPEAAALFYPLDLTDLKWGGDRRLDALQIYDEMTPDNTIAQRTVRAWQYAGDGYKPDPVVQTIYYTLKDPSAQPPFTREMLTVQKTVLHFYDEKGREIRTQKYLPASGTETGSRKEPQNTSRAEATPSPPEPARNVSPTLELEGLIIKFEKGIDPERQSVYASVRQSCLEDKKKGKEKDNSAWNSAWMKEPDYYANLDTPELAVECFTMPDPGRFGRELQLRIDPIYGVIRYEVFHNGFAEWFKREDMWKGMLAVNEYLSSQIEWTQAEYNPQVSHVSDTFDQIGTLYVIPPLRKQITGREGIFLASCLRVVEKYRKYMENSIRAGDDSLDFFCEPLEVAQLTMLLARQVDLQRYAEIETAITSVRFLDEQNDRDLLSFLTLVVDSLDGFVTDQDNRRLDEILTKKASPSEPEAVQYSNERARRVRDLFNSYVRGEEIDEAYLTRRIPNVPKFDWADIPILLELAQSEKDAKRIPHSLESSYYQQRCREGMIALWLIQGLRRKQVALVRQSQTGDENRPGDHYHLTLNPICWKGKRNTDRSPQLQRELLDAFRGWWRRFGALPAEQAALFDPLDLTDLKFGGDPHANFEPLEIYEKIAPDGTIAHTVLRECLYQPLRSGRKLRTVYYTLKDPSAPPRFTKEMLTPQRVVLHFYDENGGEIRTESIFPSPR